MTEAARYRLIQRPGAEPLVEVEGAAPTSAAPLRLPASWVAHARELVAAAIADMGQAEPRDGRAKLAAVAHLRADAVLARGQPLFVLASTDGLEAVAVPLQAAPALLRALVDAERELVEAGVLDREGTAS